MNREKIIAMMDEAFKEDRERFFKVADTLSFQPKYNDYLEELETLKQTWRDIPGQEDYPNINHPMALPEWFPKVNFASSWEKDKYIEEMLKVEDFEPVIETEENKETIENDDSNSD